MPHEDRRSILFDALKLHLQLIAGHIPHGTAWVDGGFTVRKDDPPDDVDLVVIVDEWPESMVGADAEVRQQLYSLMTLQDAIIGRPGPMALTRLRTMGGIVDAFIATRGNAEYWDRLWSSVRSHEGLDANTVTKGYVEVTW